MAFNWENSIKRAQRLFKRRKALFQKNGDSNASKREERRIK